MFVPLCLAFIGSVARPIPAHAVGVTDSVRKPHHREEIQGWGRRTWCLEQNWKCSPFPDLLLSSSWLIFSEIMKVQIVSSRARRKAWNQNEKLKNLLKHITFILFTPFCCKNMSSNHLYNRVALLWSNRMLEHGKIPAHTARSVCARGQLYSG